jgi:hypothetical protein
MHGGDGNAYRTVVGKLTVREHLGDLGVDARIILRQMLKKQGVRMCIGFAWLKIGFSWRRILETLS